jgi:hypothetical protein
MLNTQFISFFLYYYKNYIVDCNQNNQKILLKPQLFYYLQPLFIYLYSISFTYKSFLCTLLFIELFYACGKSGDLINKNALIKYSNDISSYKIMKFFNHTLFHIIFYLKLFYLKNNEPSSKYIILLLLNLFQLGMYINKSYVRRLEYIEELQYNKEFQLIKEKPENNQLIVYPSYYKIPIITSNKEEIRSIIKYTNFFVSQNYYFYIFGLIHFWIYFL